MLDNTNNKAASASGIPKKKQKKKNKMRRKRKECREKNEVEWRYNKVSSTRRWQICGQSTLPVGKKDVAYNQVLTYTYIHYDERL